MNIAKNEFEKKVWAKYPRKFCHVYNGTPQVIVYMIDNTPYYGMSHSQLINISSHVWQEDPSTPGFGEVIKDDDGIFASVGPTGIPAQILTQSGPMTITLPNAGQYHYTIIGGGGSGGSGAAAQGPGGGNGGGGWNIIEVLEYYPNKEPDKTPAKCQCGAHSVGSNRHSKWCDLSTLEGN